MDRYEHKIGALQVVLQSAQCFVAECVCMCVHCGVFWLDPLN